MKVATAEFSSLLDMLDEVLEEMHDGICITDGNGIILYVSPTCQDLYGISSGTYEGQFISVLEQQGIFAPSVILKVLKKGSRISIIQKDRHGQEILVTGVPIFDEQKNIILVISYASWDISNFREMQNQYDKLQKKMQRFSAELQEFRRKDLSVSMVAESPKMQQVKSTIGKVAGTDICVLLLGETGSGKNTVAKHIHRSSSRAQHSFVHMSCNTFSGDVMEDELFGYVKVNPATGEEQEKIGLCETANGGTLYLSDIEYMSWETQGKLLHLLKNQYYFKPGSKEIKNVNLRLIASTGRDLREMVKQNTFRDELYYRLSVAHIQVPSLKERKEDIPILTTSFLNTFNEKYHKSKSFSPQAMNLLLTYNWPGNVRELKYLVEQMVLSVEEERIQGYHLPNTVSPFASSSYESTIELKEYLDFYEGRLVLQAYEKCKTTIGVAKFLGISQASAVRKLQKYVKNYGEHRSIQK